MFNKSIFNYSLYIYRIIPKLILILFMEGILYCICKGKGQIKKWWKKRNAIGFVQGAIYKLRWACFVGEGGQLKQTCRFFSENFDFLRLYFIMYLKYKIQNIYVSSDNNHFLGNQNYLLTTICNKVFLCNIIFGGLTIFTYFETS